MPFIILNPETDQVEFLSVDKYSQKDPIIANQIAIEPINYFTNTFKCFEISETIARALNYWIQAPEDKFIETHEVVKITTVGKLLMRDIQFDKDSRQGKPTAHRFYDIPQVINANLFSILAAIMLGKKYLHRAEELITQHVIKTCRIINIQLEVKDKLLCPSEQLYYQQCGSTGVLMLLHMEIELLQELFGDNKKIKLENFANNIRTFLTIVDECKRAALDDTDDIEMGHFSFPLVYAINETSEDREVLLDFMRQRTKDKIVLKYALSILRKSGCFEYARTKLYSLKKEILQEYKKLGKNPLMEKFFEEYLQIPAKFEDVNWTLI